MVIMQEGITIQRENGSVFAEVEQGTLRRGIGDDVEHGEVVEGGNRCAAPLAESTDIYAFPAPNRIDNVEDSPGVALTGEMEDYRAGFCDRWHTSLSIAFPRWEMVFFSSMEISARVLS